MKYHIILDKDKKVLGTVLKIDNNLKIEIKKYNRIDVINLLKTKVYSNKKLTKQL